MNENIILSRELLQQVFDSLDSRCGTNAPERAEIIPKLIELLDAPAGELIGEQPAPVQEPVAWRLKDEDASTTYGKSIYAYYDAADIRLDHPDAKKLTVLLEPLYTSPPSTAEHPLLTEDEQHEMIDNVIYRRWSLVDLVKNTEKLVWQKAGLK